jgi:hypothetical protein
VIANKQGRFPVRHIKVLGGLLSSMGAAADLDQADKLGLTADHLPTLAVEVTEG